MVAGLKECRWPGRCQTLKERGITWYVDGAHTPESLEMCAEWFKQAAAIEKKSLEYVSSYNTYLIIFIFHFFSFPVLVAMVFNFSGKRDGTELMGKLTVRHFVSDSITINFGLYRISQYHMQCSVLM